MSKKVLHFQVPEWMMKDRKVLANSRQLWEAIQNKFSKKYDIIVSPLILQADGAINITITPDTDIAEVIMKLLGFMK